MDFGFDDGLYDWGEAQAEDQAGAEEASLHGDKDDEDTQVFDFDEDDEDAYPPDGDGHQDGGGPPDDKNQPDQDGAPAAPGGEEPPAGSTSGRSSLTSSARRRRGNRGSRTTPARWRSGQIPFPLSFWNLIRILCQEVPQDLEPAGDHQGVLAGLDSLTGAAALELEEVSDEKFNVG